jgi:hypothetical protein
MDIMDLVDKLYHLWESGKLSEANDVAEQLQGAGWKVTIVEPDTPNFSVCASPR